MFGIIVTVPFEAAHRITLHGGKCRHMHGHSYRADIHLRCDTLDPMGMVADFGVVKKDVKLWIDSNWDHNAILSYRDPLPKLGRLMKEQGYWTDPNAWNDGKEPYIMSEGREPTAELIGMELYERIKGWGYGWVKFVTHIVIYEGFPGGQALYSPEPLDGG